VLSPLHISGVKNLDHYQEKEIGRWIAVPAGILLGLIALLCLFGSVTLFLDQPAGDRFFGLTVGVILVLGCVWVLDKAVRMVIGSRGKGGLLAPMTLRVIAVLFLLLPLAGFFTGYFSEKGWLAILQAIGSLAIFAGLVLLSRRQNP
jgi:hypothetical protein